MVQRIKKKKDYFLEQFQVHSKFERKMQRMPIPPTLSPPYLPTINIPHQSGILVILDKPTLTYYLSKSIVYIRVTLGAVRSIICLSEHLTPHCCHQRFSERLGYTKKAGTFLWNFSKSLMSMMACQECYHKQHFLYLFSHVMFCLKISLRITALQDSSLGNSVWNKGSSCPDSPVTLGHIQWWLITFRGPRISE